MPLVVRKDLLPSGIHLLCCAPCERIKKRPGEERIEINKKPRQEEKNGGKYGFGDAPELKLHRVGGTSSPKTVLGCRLYFKA